MNYQSEKCYAPVPGQIIINDEVVHFLDLITESGVFDSPVNSDFEEPEDEDMEISEDEGMSDYEETKSEDQIKIDFNEIQSKDHEINCESFNSKLNMEKQKEETTTRVTSKEFFIADIINEINETAFCKSTQKDISEVSKTTSKSLLETEEEVSKKDSKSVSEKKAEVTKTVLEKDVSPSRKDKISSTAKNVILDEEDNIYSKKVIKKESSSQHKRDQILKDSDSRKDHEQHVTSITIKSRKKEFSPPRPIKKEPEQKFSSSVSKLYVDEKVNFGASTSRNFYGYIDRDSPSYHDEPKAIAEVLGGSYVCKVCKVNLNSERMYRSHISGKRHAKAVKAQNMNKIKTIPPPDLENMTRYPAIPDEVERIEIDCTSVIQREVEDLKIPCPGLDKVIEINKIHDTIFYCSMCDSPCSRNSIIPHLQGFKHLLNCLKRYDPRRYDDLKDRKKSSIESEVIRVLKDVVRVKGRGCIRVEKEVLKDKDGNDSDEEDSRPYPVPVPYRGSSMKYDDYADSYGPDPNKSDFYCELCDAHMNNEEMWDSHLRGKRHMKNKKKPPGERPTKAKTVLDPNRRAELFDLLDKDKSGQPVVGLEDMREVHNPHVTFRNYHCFLCGSYIQSQEVLDHIYSRKHRMAYLEKIDHPDFKLITDLGITETSALNALIFDACVKAEKERGRGHLEVHVPRETFRPI